MQCIFQIADLAGRIRGRGQKNTGCLPLHGAVCQFKPLGCIAGIVKLSLNRFFLGLGIVDRFRQLHLGVFELLCQLVGPLDFYIQLRTPLGDLRQLGLVGLCLLFHSNDLLCLLPLFV